MDYSCVQSWKYNLTVWAYNNLSSLDSVHSYFSPSMAYLGMISCACFLESSRAKHVFNWNFMLLSWKSFNIKKWKLKAGGSRLLKCELFQYQKHDQTFASLLYPWGPSRNGGVTRRNWKEFNEGTIYKGVEGARSNKGAVKHPGIRAIGEFTTPGLKRWVVLLLLDLEKAAVVEEGAGYGCCGLRGGRCALFSALKRRGWED